MKNNLIIILMFLFISCTFSSKENKKTTENKPKDLLGDTIVIAKNDIISKYELNKLTLKDFKKRDTSAFTSDTSGNISCGTVTKHSSLTSFTDTINGVTLNFSATWFDNNPPTEEVLTEIKLNQSKAKFYNGITLNKSTQKEVKKAFGSFETKDTNFLYRKNDSVAYSFFFNEKSVLTNIYIRYIKPKKIVNTTTCDNEINFKKNLETTVRFNALDFKETDADFERWSKDSVVKKVTSMKLSGYNEVPKRFAVFSEVEKIILVNSKGISGLDMFPKLKQVYFWGSTLDISNGKNWKNNIEVLIVEKTRLKGLKSFKELPNLKLLDMTYSRFDTFPKGLDKLKHISRITLGASMDKIDLSSLDFSTNQCLKKITLHTHYGGFTSIPKNLEQLDLNYLEIKHSKMTDAEKNQIKTLKEKFNK